MTDLFLRMHERVYVNGIAGMDGFLDEIETIVIAAFAVVRWYDRLGNVVVSHEIEALERALCASEPPREEGT